jgi:hypothetical protein
VAETAGKSVKQGHEMQGLLADVNVQGFLPYICDLLAARGLLPMLIEQQIQFKTFKDLQIDPNLDDRSLWKLCQRDGWVLFTEDRNDDGPDSLQATITELWREGDLPIVTLSNKSRLRRDRSYGNKVVDDIAELLTDIKDLKIRDQQRIYVPLSRKSPR